MRPLFLILGPLEVEGGAPLGGPQQRALLRRLLLSPNRVVSVDRLVDAVWGETAPQRAREALQVYVSHLRKAVPDGAARIRWEQGGYRISVEQDELDSLRFERLVEQGRARLASGETAEAVAMLRDALDLWRGPPEGDGADDPELARLEELRLAALEDRIDAELQLGRQRELVPELEALVAQEPLHERLRRQLMLALYRSGRQADALEAYHDARRVLVEELGLEPSAELRMLEAAILRQDPALSVEPAELRASRRLPTPATALIGRRREVDEVCELLGGEARLVTLTGPGGTGKTRVAIQAAYELAERFADGAAFVGLAALRDPALVLSEIATALEVSNGHDPRAALADYLRERNELLVIDNFEQVDEAAPALTSMLANAPDLKLLVTSRRSLRVYGEHEFPVAPLALEEEAVPLFLERARAAGRSLQVSEDVREICRRLDCLPLAIELVAARARELTAAEMRSLLDASLELASRGPRDVPARQQTLRATIEWSYALLDSDARRLFEALGVFAGGCTLGDAESMTGASPSAIRSLVDKSLLRRERLGDTELREREARLGMLETIREYALERLEASGEAERVHRRHAEHLLALAEEADPAQAGADQAMWLDRIAREYDNLRAALTWLASAGEAELRLRLATALQNVWLVHGRFSEGRRWLEDALESSAAAPAALRAYALAGIGRLAYRQGAFEAATRAWEEALGLYRELGDTTGIARSIGELGSVAVGEEDYERAASLYEESAALFRQAGDKMRFATVLMNQGAIANIQGDYARGRRFTEEALAVHRELGVKDNICVAVHNLGRVALYERRYADAAAQFRESLAIGRELSYKELIAYCLEGLAEVAAVEDPERAAELLGAADALVDETGVVLMGEERESRERTVEALRAELGEGAFESKRAEGRERELEKAIERALETDTERKD